MINLDELNDVGNKFMGKTILSNENRNLIKQLIRPFYDFKSKEIWYEFNLRKNGPDYIFRITEREKLVELSKKMITETTRKSYVIWKKIYDFSLKWNNIKKEYNNYIKSISFEFDYEQIEKDNYPIPCVFIEIDAEEYSGKVNELYKNIFDILFSTLYEGDEYKSILRNLISVIDDINNLTFLWQIGFMYSRNDIGIRIFTNLIDLNDSLKFVNKYSNSMAKKLKNKMNYFKEYLYPQIILDFDIDERGCKINDLLGLNVHINGFNNIKSFLKQLYNEEFISSDYINELIKWYGKNNILDGNTLNLIQRDIAHFKVKISSYNDYNIKIYLRAEIIAEYDMK